MATAKLNPVSGVPDGPTTARGGYFSLSFRIATLCWIASVILQVAMYLRPAPHGGPFLIEWERYFWLAIYYDMLGIWLISSPFFLGFLIMRRRNGRAGPWRGALAVQAALLTAYLALSQLDHEVMRFLGVRLNPSFLYAYGQPRMLGDPLFLEVLANDHGGPFMSVALLLLVPAAYGWWCYRIIGMASVRAWSAPLWLALVLAVVPLAAPANAWWQATSHFRLRKVEPVSIAFATDAANGFAEWSRPVDFAALAGDYQRNWRARSADPAWRFPDPERPYLREPTDRTATSAAERWNIIYLQLETLRGMDVGALNPQTDRSATPFLDQLATAPDAAVWTRAVSFGMPSINGLFAGHCSVPPSSRRYITGYTDTALLCLPELLREHGYRAEMFNGGDTDWDNSSPWLRQWYDRLWRFPEADGRDRIIFRAAAQHLRRLGRGDAPFLATIVSVTNHTPFRSREPAFDIDGDATPAQRIRNTTHYTDDVVREFIASIRDEPWFARTLIVITGDHGFNTGEHGLTPGQQDLFRESVWVPLIISGAHPRLPAGRHEMPASLLDIAPTIADLLDIRVANPWTGHSLLAVREGGGLGFAVRDSSLWESSRWSAVREPGTGAVRLYARDTDWLQRRDLAGSSAALAHRLISRAERAGRLNDYLLRQDRIWRSAGETQPGRSN